MTLTTAHGADRRATSLLHLQAAACARPTAATLAAQVEHLHREVHDGAYPAEVAVAPVVDRLRTRLGELLGSPGDGVLIVESATSGLRTLLAAWSLPPGSRVAVTPSEWGPNLATVAAAGHRTELLAVDDDGVLDLDALDTRLASDPPAAVHLVHTASHRALLQPVDEALRRCRAAGVPLWLDVAQALGHHPTAHGADAAYAPGRKWLRGPRGTGVLAIDPRHAATLRRAREHPPGDLSVAAVVGLARAVDDLDDVGLSSTVTALGERGDAVRELAADLPGWELADASGHGGALVALRPTAGQDVQQVQARLAEQRVLTTACLPWRAPGDMTGPLLRLAPHVDTPPRALASLSDLLAGT